MALPARVWTAGKVLLLVGALAATFVVFAVLAARVAVRARDVSVPDLVGQSAGRSDRGRDRARAAAECRRLAPPGPAGPRGPCARPGAPGGFARPAGNAACGCGSAAGPRIARAPALVGESRARRARSESSRTACSLGRSPKSAPPLYPPDVVVAQDPPPGVQTTEVRLLVNRGEDRATYVMPDLIGVNGDRAADLLRSQGFRVVASRPSRRRRASRPASSRASRRPAAIRCIPAMPSASR